MTIATNGIVEVGEDDLRVNIDGVSTATRVWDLLRTTPGTTVDAAADFFTWASLTGLGDVWNGMRVVDYAVRRAGASFPKQFKVTLSYSNEAERDPNPLLEPARVSFSGEYYQEPVFRDRYGNAIATKSGEYPEGLFEDLVQLNFTVSKNVASVPAWVLAASGSVNVSPFSIRGLAFAAETCRLGVISGSDELTRNGYVFYKLSIPVSYRLKGWKTEFMHRGFYQRTTPTAVPTPCVDGNNQAVTVPAPLDINGKQITNPTVSNIVILEFDTKPSFDFNTLPLS